MINKLNKGHETGGHELMFRGHCGIGEGGAQAVRTAV